jgi:DNA adenine methylase
MPKLKAPFAWYGGKSRLADWIISHFPPHDVYIEPFGGAASVLLAKAPCKVEIYNDLNSGVVNFYRCLRDADKTAELQRRLELTPYSREEFLLCREYIYTEEPYGYGDIEHAWNWAVCAMQCHSGTIGCGRGPSWGAQFDPNAYKHMARSFRSETRNLMTICDRLAEVQINNKGAVKLMEQTDRLDALFYLDPPYHDDTGDSAYKDKIDYTELIQTCLDLRGMCLLSGYAHECYQPLLDAGWAVDTIETHMTAARPSTTGGKREPRTESLYINPACQAALTRANRQVEI